MTLREVREATAQLIADAVGGMNAYDFEPDGLTVPAVVVRPANEFATYQTRFGGTSTMWQLEAVLLVSRGVSEAAQARLDAWAERTGPVVTALHAPGQTLGGRAERVSVTGARDYGHYRFGEGLYYGFSLILEIEA